MSLEEYKAFVESKTHLAGQFGFKPTYENPNCYDFQNHLIDWALRMGRGATFADCGLGKTLMQLVWAENIYRHTNRPVLILAPLSVSAQTAEEAEKFGIEAYRSQDGKFPAGKGIITTNYERLHHFDESDFSGIVCDESSILKNAEGSLRNRITKAMRKVMYRGMYTATPSPNDYTELGTSSEALGDMAYMDMLQTFFKSNDDTLHPAHIGQNWRFKGHAEPHFWRWVASWARAVRKPSDLGFSDEGWNLPELVEHDLSVAGSVRDGFMFEMPLQGMKEARIEKKARVKERCELAAQSIIGHAEGVSWCHTNEEASLLTQMIPGAVNLSGSDKDGAKEEKFIAFRSGEIKHLVTKPQIAALGVNWQHCAACTYFDDYSYEKKYQAVRRFWRFGQKRPVTVYNIGVTSLSSVTNSQKRKAEQADRQFEQMMAHMIDAQSHRKIWTEIEPVKTPSWM